jgi:hypothetical protein
MWTGGGTGHGPHDVYPDGWLVTLAKFNPDTNQSVAISNTRFEHYNFFQKGYGCFNKECYLPEYELVASKKLQYIQWE